MQFTLRQLLLAVAFIAFVLAFARISLPWSIYLCMGLFTSWLVGRLQRSPREEPRPPGTWTYREVVGDED